ncbi:Dehydrin [Musa troglodytarum]|uniref:Dehydrin n=1 Tax=Musa troglodytarum TaxID=320322 RepID=A0A9E7H4U0_9LILI|nr:Dehydrin [Musa troglodytarum]
MAEEHHKAVESGEEVQDRGLFDFLGKKKEEEKTEECHEEVLVSGVEKIHLEEAGKEEDKKEGLLEKLHRSHSSSSSSSSDEEEEDGGENKEKKKKKKGLKEKIKEKLGCDKKEGEEEAKLTEVHVEHEVVAAAAVTDGDDTVVVVEKVEESIVKVEAGPQEEKKGFLEKIKEKLPGHKKPAEEIPAACAAEHEGEGEGEGHEGKEKKGILGKLMEKLPGYHKAEEKEGEKSSPAH